jgi:hypothetical protein
MSAEFYFKTRKERDRLDGVGVIERIILKHKLNNWIVLMFIEWLQTGFIIGLIEYIQSVTTNIYYSYIELHTAKVTAKIAHIKSS